MMPGNVFGRWVADATALATEPVAGPVTGGPGRRVDLGRVLTGLRHLPAAAEPARVCTDLAAVCVPALCAEGVIGSVGTGTGSGDLSQGHAPAATDRSTDPAATGDAGLSAPWSGNGPVVTISGGSVVARFVNASCGCEGLFCAPAVSL